MESNQAARILVIEDDPDIVAILGYNLEHQECQVTVANDGSTGLEVAQQNEFDLILIDIMLPNLNGLEVCKKLRQSSNTENVAIIMVTAKNSEKDIVAGLNAGADDYIGKPFSPKEVVARVKAHLRRLSRQKGSDPAMTADYLEAGPIFLNLASHEAKINGNLVTLTHSEYKLLQALVSSQGRVLTRDQLLDKVRGEDITVVDRNIDVHISSLRKKLREAATMITTIRGVGYRFDL